MYIIYVLSSTCLTEVLGPARLLIAEGKLVYMREHYQPAIVWLLKF